MSGGVDSSVTAALLKAHGLNVQGLYMRNWDSFDERGVCSANDEWDDVRRVCDTLRIPCREINFVKEYWTDVFQQTLEDYAAGLTPNPDILCNQYIKFGALFDRTAKQRDDVWLATGHYCRTNEHGQLLRGRDSNKDQSYYLSSVTEASLKRTLFPLGDYASKADVKAEALRFGLHDIAAKPESMGICFVGQRRRFADFLAEYIDQPPGPAVDLQGNVIGQHRGLYAYTIGQASGICHGAHKMVVAQKRVKDNTLVLVPGSNHPALFRTTCHARNWVWIHPSSPLQDQILHEPVVVDAQIRYRMKPQKARLSRHQGRYTLEFFEPVRAIAPGQQVVVWHGDWCLGGGVIIE
ncbi:tRNA methyl transferase [Syncephalastrum racemosum]|uniref:tRNA-5-taurinomethyluridine 2-sulfurtransferase n=1 Tax=Syncephalastrum racemosum TaxID=13706 RepID=A0A1X2HHY6_SYNRA|nr:tRNA methyl transferase [Syncephalastrum racemosum]